MDWVKLDSRFSWKETMAAGPSGTWERAASTPSCPVRKSDDGGGDGKATASEKLGGVGWWLFTRVKS